MGKTRTPDILRKSHRHLEGNERAKGKDELRHTLLEIDREDEDAGSEASEAPSEPGASSEDE